MITPYNQAIDIRSSSPSSSHIIITSYHIISYHHTITSDHIIISSYRHIKSCRINMSSPQIIISSTYTMSPSSFLVPSPLSSSAVISDHHIISSDHQIILSYFLMRMGRDRPQGPKKPRLHQGFWCNLGPKMPQDGLDDPGMTQDTSECPKMPPRLPKITPR